MASADLSRRVQKVVGYPPLSDMSTRQRREVSRDAARRRHLRGAAWQVAGGDPQRRGQPTEAAARLRRLPLRLGRPVASRMNRHAHPGDSCACHGGRGPGHCSASAVAAIGRKSDEEGAIARRSLEARIDKIAKGTGPPSVCLHPDGDPGERAVKAALNPPSPRNPSPPTTPSQPCQVRPLCEGLPQPEGVVARRVTSQYPFGKPARRLAQDVRPRLATETKVSRNSSGYVAERAGPDSTHLQLHFPPRDLSAQDDIAVSLGARRDIRREEKRPLRVDSGDGGVAVRNDGVSTSGLRGLRAALSAMFATAVEDGPAALKSRPRYASRAPPTRVTWSDRARRKLSPVPSWPCAGRAPAGLAAVL